MLDQTPVQIAWVTRDLDATEMALTTLLGAKKWVRMPGVQHLQRVNHPSIGSRGTAFEEFDLQSFLLVHAQYVRNVKTCELSLMGPKKLNA